MKVSWNPVTVEMICNVQLTAALNWMLMSNINVKALLQVHFKPTFRRRSIMTQLTGQRPLVL